ncbi:hypothetical protein Dsin_023213 [Dipteronia sinensis]|uniref:Uncharacterized protein n=1 Tax=Dipteronia sinensis TaxID=43782 RepID=A0AAE0A2V4_9ROSI|nr:hypothetical protein Dsin_023213 [Dipteronia sinensis]
MTRPVLFVVSSTSFSWGNTQERQVADITAIHGVTRPLIHVRAVRRKGCVTESCNPSPHGGRGALPSEGGSPSDLLFLAGGGSSSSSVFPAFF